MSEALNFHFAMLLLMMFQPMISLFCDVVLAVAIIVSSAPCYKVNVVALILRTHQQ